MRGIEWLAFDVVYGGLAKGFESVGIYLDGAYMTDFISVSENCNIK